MVIQALDQIDGFDIVAIPNVTLLHLHEFADEIEHAQLAAALQMKQQQFDLFELAKLSLCQLVALFCSVAVEDVLPARFVARLAAQSFPEEVEQLHESVVDLALSLAHRQVVLVLLHAVLLAVGEQGLVDLCSSEGPDDHLLAEESAVYAEELVFVRIMMRAVAEVDGGESARPVALLRLLYLQNRGQPRVIVIVRRYPFPHLQYDLHFQAVPLAPPAQKVRQKSLARNRQQSRFQVEGLSFFDLLAAHSDDAESSVHIRLEVILPRLP